MAEFQYERRLVAFVDIVGWSAACKSEDADTLKNVGEVATIMRRLPVAFREDFKKTLTMTPGAVLSVDHQVTEVTTFSDSLAVSTSTDVGNTLFFTFLTLVCRELLTHGFLARGGVTVGDLCHVENMIFGPALIEAVDLQEEAIYPRLLCSHALAQQVQSTSPNVIIKDHLGRDVINLLAFVSGPNPVQWADLESSIERNLKELNGKQEWKNLEKWHFMRDVLQAMVHTVCS